MPYAEGNFPLDFSNEAPTVKLIPVGDTLYSRVGLKLDRSCPVLKAINSKSGILGLALVVGALVTYPGKVMLR